ncbi:protein MAINTENANCE OF MERISTEMS-like [Telopea speciosissima]|uniref:protein MAINTENANCE OF MERISTEMS-like n=1 Tax=Telopea speciosissima TaxID=54955 RepID=UPI001CC636FD|nr:protein MAINTENANCE OF MERISTEMS-like [Telopea speciosissima]
MGSNGTPLLPKRPQSLGVTIWEGDDSAFHPEIDPDEDVLSDCDEKSRAPRYEGRLLRETPLHICNSAWKLPKVPVTYHKYGSRSTVLSWYGQLCGAVRQWVVEAGFEDLALLQTRSFDMSLAQALAERWWPTTHTYHLPMGEMTITPLCYFLYTGLSFGGEAVVGHPGGWTFDDQELMRLLGSIPSESYTAVQWFYREWDEKMVTDSSSREELDQQARCFILYLLGNTLFSTSRMTIHISMVWYLKDLLRVKKFDWVGVGYAHMLRMLDSLAMRGTELVDGT